MLTVNNNRQNFTARLDLANIKLNKNRWDNISKMFAEKTQEFLTHLNFRTAADNLIFMRFLMNWRL